jgi:hypothetical protein
MFNAGCTRDISITVIGVAQHVLGDRMCCTAQHKIMPQKQGVTTQCVSGLWFRASSMTMLNKTPTRCTVDLKS